jgi:energy-coupling factor transporter ATP-binding protein EcfA2
MSIEIDGLSYRYPGRSGPPALHGVSLTIAPGERVLVAGGSGSGKSTLLRALSGLVPHFHGGTAGGQVIVDGHDTRRCGPGDLARSVGTVLQDPETQIVMGTVAAELAFGLENRGWAPAAVARGVEEAAQALAIGHLLPRATAELSGGELQRVALGAALAGHPAVIVLDEPTSQLDPVAGDELIGLLARINDDTDATIVLAEHRLERCLGWADRVIVLDAGRVICDADPAGFLGWATAQAPALATPGARLLHELGVAPAPGVRGARAALRAHGWLGGAGRGAGEGARPAPATRLPAARTVGAPAADEGAGRPRLARLRRHRPDAGPPVLQLRGVWQELREGPVILRDVSLRLAAGERVAVMGANGAGKSTLLRHAAGLDSPTRGRVSAVGRVALLLQHPGDYLVHETVAAEAPASARDAVGLGGELDGRHPRDLSGGERQRLALAVVLGDGPPPAVLCLDEPTRGMDRAHRHRLTDLLAQLPGAVLLATHDPEFAAAVAGRVVLLAGGRIIADGSAAEILGGGRYFATETARILHGAGGALTPEAGARLLRARRAPRADGDRAMTGRPA